MLSISDIVSVLNRQCLHPVQPILTYLLSDYCFVLSEICIHQNSTYSFLCVSLSSFTSGHFCICIFSF